MKKFIVKVDGNSYEVEVEEVMSDVTSSNDDNMDSQGIQEPAPQAPAKPNAGAGVSSSKPVATGSTVIKAPMPGTILDINVNEGDTVKKGQVLCILEAMKMENEIMSPKDGKIVSVNTSKGVSVESGDILFSIE